MRGHPQVRLVFVPVLWQLEPRMHEMLSVGGTHLYQVKDVSSEVDFFHERMNTRDE